MAGMQTGKKERNKIIRKLSNTQKINIKCEQIPAESYRHSYNISNQSTIHNANLESTTIGRCSGPWLFSITAEISNPIAKRRAAGLVTPCFGDGQSKLKLLQLMPPLDISRTRPDSNTVQRGGWLVQGASTGGRDYGGHSCISFYFDTFRHPYAAISWPWWS